MSDELDDLTDPLPAPVRRGGRGNVADREALAERDRSLKQRKHEGESDVRWLMEQPQFRRVVWRWIRASGYFVRERRTDAVGFILHGRAEMGAELWNELAQANLDALLEMFRAASLTEKSPND